MTCIGIIGISVNEEEGVLRVSFWALHLYFCHDKTGSQDTSPPLAVLKTAFPFNVMPTQFVLKKNSLN